MPVKLKYDYKKTLKWHIITYHLKQYLRIFLLYFPSKSLWYLLFFKSERRKIVTKIEANGDDPKLLLMEMNLFPPLNIELLLPSSVRRSGIMVESDMYFCYFKTLEEIGINVRQSTLAKLHYQQIEKVNCHDNILKSQIPNILVLDGNLFYSKELNEYINYVRNLRSLGAKILVDLPDCYLTKDGLAQIEFWQKYCDLIVYHNPNIPSHLDDSKFLLWPGFPLPLTHYNYSWELKVDKLLMQGSSHRQRSLYYQGAVKSNLPIVGQHHNRLSVSEVSNTYLEYVEKIKTTKYIFTNGYLNSRESIIVGRAFETLASGSVLLYEKGSKLSTFYDEYSDYLPIHNISDLVEKFNFLIENSDVSSRIASNAKKRTIQLYNSCLFWNLVFSKLEFI